VPSKFSYLLTYRPNHHHYVRIGLQAETGLKVLGKTWPRPMILHHHDNKTGTLCISALCQLTLQYRWRASRLV